MKGSPPETQFVPTGAYPPTTELTPRLEWFKEQLDRCSDAVFHTFTIGKALPCALIYIQGMFDYPNAEEHLLAPLLGESSERIDDPISLFEEHRVSLSRTIVLDDPEEAIKRVMMGHGLLLLEGEPRLLELPFVSYETRALEEAPTESVIRGPREAFVESLGTNLTLLRRRIKSPLLKTERLTFGVHTQTTVILTYLEGTCPDRLVREVKRRLAGIRIDGVLGSSYLEEIIQDAPYSPFPQLQYTERPDTVSASLLEGRIAILVDNTPMVMIAPVTFFIMLQSAEDYYQPFIAASWIRWIRFIFLSTSLLLPSFYIAITTFHPEMLPFNLLVSVSSSREIVPFPALMEALMMELAFEALREASVRIPKSIGQAVSIIGALIIGTAAVQAGIVSAAMVIIVSVTGIASFIIPNFDLGLSFRLLRFPMMLLAGIFGIFGIACGMILIYVHLVNLKSFGTPYLTPVTPQIARSLKDAVYRAPWWKMRSLPFMANRTNRAREIGNMRAWASSEGTNDE